MKQFSAVIVFLLYFVINTKAQSVAISNDNSIADPSAILDLKSSTKGLLIPRMTKEQRIAIASPAAGLMLYQTDDITGFWCYNGNSWLPVQGNSWNHNLSQTLTTNNQLISSTGDNTGLKLGDSGALRLITRVSYPDATTGERFRIDPDGGFLLKSNLGVGYSPMEGSGYRVSWHPYKGAWRAGYAIDEWDDVNTGFFSFAGGSQTIASGIFSFSFGDNNKATGTSSIAFGSNNKVFGTGGFSAGAGNFVERSYGAALGTNARAGGLSAMAFGYSVTSKGFASTVVGMYNDSLLLTSETSVSATTPLFIVGNGSNNASRSNALVVRKNGNVEVENFKIGGGTLTSRQQSGTLQVGQNNSNFKTVTMNFPVAFTGTPKIIATARNQAALSVNETFVVTVRAVTSTAVTFNIMRIDAAAAWAQLLQLDWMAWE